MSEIRTEMKDRVLRIEIARPEKKNALTQAMYGAMADALDVDEPWVGVMILAPAALDAWRYVKPESRWAVWTSRALKVGAVLIVVRAAR